MILHDCRNQSIQFRVIQFHMCAQKRKPATFRGGLEKTKIPEFS